MKPLPIIAGLLLALVIIVGALIVRAQETQKADANARSIWMRLNDNLSEFSEDVSGLPNDKESLRALREKADRLANESSDLRGEAMANASAYHPLIIEIAEKEQKYARNVGDATVKQVSMQALQESEHALLEKMASLHDKTLWTSSPDRSDIQKIDDKLTKLIALAASAEAANRKVVIIHDHYPSRDDSITEIKKHPSIESIINDSDSRLLNATDLQGWSDWELDIIRNEIYARHGRPFLKGKFHDYFASQSWYHENPNYSDADLNETERRNAAFILSYQHATGRATQ